MQLYHSEFLPPTLVSQREGKAHFNCSSLEGVEVEDGGGRGTALSHWEERILEVSACMINTA